MKKIIQKLSFPEDIFSPALKIIKKLHANNYQAFFVGGCVRDSLLNFPCKDIDITTNAKPEEVKKLFSRTTAIGEAFGVINVYLEGRSFDIATFRAESDYRDGRHPQQIQFADAQADAMRRDFTINAIFYNPETTEIIDFFDGFSDLKNSLLITVGNAEERFLEDHLRMLRAIRFAARFQLKIDEEIINSIKKLAPLITKVSPERIFSELNLILTNKNINFAFELLFKTNLLQQIIPELCLLKDCPQPIKYHPEGDAWNHTMLALSQITNNASDSLGWSVLLHDIGKPTTLLYKPDGTPATPGHAFIGSKIAKEILLRLRASNRLVKEVCYCVNNHMKFSEVQKMRKSTLLHFLSDSNFPLLLEVHRIDVLSATKNLENYQFIKDFLKNYEGEKGEMLAIPFVNGDDLKKLGYKPSSLFKIILAKIYNLQLENHFKEKKEAIEYITSHFPIN